METFEIIRGLREDRDLTQQNMADLLKIGPTIEKQKAKAKEIEPEGESSNA